MKETLTNPGPVRQSQPMTTEKPQDKASRHATLLTLIRTRRLGTQADLVEALQAEGLEVTQSSVSRDLEELGIVKRKGLYVIPESAASTHRLKSITPVGTNLVILRCESGFASAIAAEIDRAHIADIAGTIAGDDTIFIAIPGTKEQKNVVDSLTRLFAKVN